MTQPDNERSLQGNSEQNLQPQLIGIHDALHKGFTLHGFRSGGGLRVISIEKFNETDSKGYGEAPNVEEALMHANEDFIAGGRPYLEVYGKIHPHYLTGSSDSTSPLDNWLLRGHTLDAFLAEGEIVVVDLKGYTDYSIPQEVLDIVKSTGTHEWKDRGFSFEIEYDPHFFANGDEGWSYRVIDSPEGRKATDGFLFKILKRGYGKSFEEAAEAALNAEAIEITNDDSNSS